MPSITFKLMGVFGDKGERQILIDEDINIGKAKKIVRKKFKLVPNAKVTFLWKGKRYGAESNDIKFKRIPIDPRSEKITVIVSSPY